MGFDSGSFRVIFQGPPIKYRLYAVLVHSGYSSNSGHYYCYIRASNGVWYQMNDSIVSEKHLSLNLVLITHWITMYIDLSRCLGPFLENPTNFSGPLKAGIAKMRHFIFKGVAYFC